jgi:hypothetical protein
MRPPLYPLSYYVLVPPAFVEYVRGDGLSNLLVADHACRRHAFNSVQLLESSSILPRGMALVARSRLYFVTLDVGRRDG